jgi:hypothetical protein
MKSNIGKLALVFAMLLTMVSGFFSVYFLAQWRNAQVLTGQIVEFKNGSVPVVAFRSPDGRQLHFSDPLGPVPSGAKQGDTVSIQYIAKNGKVRLSGASFVEKIIYFFFGMGIIGVIGSTILVVSSREEPRQGISGMYGR